MNRLDKTPVVAQAKDQSGKSVTVNIDGFAFAYTLIMASERGDASSIPKMIADMARGDSAAVAATYLAWRGPPEFVGLGGVALALTVFCAEHANLTTEAATLARSKAALPGFPDRVLRVQPKQGKFFTECPVWNVGMAAPAVSAPIVSNVPVLILEGTFDAATAPEWVDLITPDLKNSQVRGIPLHGPLGPRQVQVRDLDHGSLPRQPNEAGRPNLRCTHHADIHSVDPVRVIELLDPFEDDRGHEENIARCRRSNASVGRIKTPRGTRSSGPAPKSLCC